MTAPAITSRAVVDASHPADVAGAGRIRSSLKTVMVPPLVLPRQVILVGARRGVDVRWFQIGAWLIV
ncbi:hypothetical protein G205_05706 [Arthrobacter nitrophenolicus]|uniref:Uncharacterized protein n=1 Tax=Arthrobacter nitrophenolicus TaxID=683150 RepID=L8TU80_9MICC|nr:hypothetical protein G205_05706 [Arthrobacter nitrophenolicus]